MHERFGRVCRKSPIRREQILNPLSFNLETRPKGTSGRDKPVPYDLCSLTSTTGNRVRSSLSAAFLTEFRQLAAEFLDEPALHDGQTLRVAGALAPDTFRREDGSTLSKFSLGDKQVDVPGIAPGSPKMEASYVGVLPDLFFNPHSEIILEGHYDGQEGVFATDNILVKCPSKYQSMQAESPDLMPGAVAPAQSY